MGHQYHGRHLSRHRSTITAVLKRSMHACYSLCLRPSPLHLRPLTHTSSALSCISHHAGMCCAPKALCMQAAPAFLCKTNCFKAGTS
jgi:hypothetical protein